MSIGEVDYADRELPVPSAWRPTFRKIVQAFSEGDFTLARGIDCVRSISQADAEYFAGSIDTYGATLTSLPDESWQTSIYLHDLGYWVVLVDLFTAEEGRSDLVLFARVFERGDAYEFEITSIHVP
jgi:hypothetical protein